MRRKRIKTLDALNDCALGRRSVYTDHWTFQKPKPAAFVINLQGRHLLNLFRRGLYVYESKKVKNKR